MAQCLTVRAGSSGTVGMWGGCTVLSTSSPSVSASSSSCDEPAFARARWRSLRRCAAASSSLTCCARSCCTEAGDWPLPHGSSSSSSSSSCT
eukprot:2114463-Prymnesium_polylepis.1